MKLSELFEEFDDSPYYDTTLKLGKYRGFDDPRTGEPYHGFLDASDLWDVVDDLLAKGVKPRVKALYIKELLATQD